MTTPNHQGVRPETLAACLQRAGLTAAAAARGIGITKQALDAMVSGRRPVSPRVFRDLPLAISTRTGLDPDAIRDAIFTDAPTGNGRPPASFLEHTISQEA